MKKTTYTLPAYWASYLINADESGLAIGDKWEADRFIKDNNLGSALSCGESYVARSNQANNLAGDVCDFTFPVLTKAQIKERDKAEAIAHLRAIVSPGDTLYTILRNVSSSGMSRQIDVYAFKADGERMAKYWLSGYIATACGYSRTSEGALRVGGCGMDMGFAITYALGYAMFPNGFECVGKERCRSNDHTNGDRTYEPHAHRDGGYAFRHEWI